MKKRNAMKKQWIAGLLSLVLLAGTAGAASIGDVYKTYDPETGKFSETGTPLALNLDNVAEVARNYNPSIRSTVVQADLVEKMTMWGGMYPDQVVKKANANFYSMESAVGKMSYAAQTMLYSYYSLETSLKRLSFDIQALDRNKKKMEKLFALGMISENEYNDFLLSEKEAKAAQKDLTEKRDNLFSQIAAYVNRSPGQITIDGFQLLSDNEVYSRLGKMEGFDYEDAVKVSLDILAASFAVAAAPEDDYNDMIASLKLLETENSHQMNFDSLRSSATLLGEKVKVANERYAKAEKVFAIAKRRYELGELSKMDYESAVEQLDKDYVTLLEAHMAFDGAYRKFMTLAQKGILQ